MSTTCPKLTFTTELFHKFDKKGLTLCPILL
jgi:hypothetical protein